MVTALLLMTNAVNNVYYALLKKEESDISIGITLVTLLFVFCLDVVLYYNLIIYLRR